MIIFILVEINNENKICILILYEKIWCYVIISFLILFLEMYC